MFINNPTDREYITDSSTTMEMTEKKDVRRLYRERRNRMTSDQTAVLSAQICENILNSQLFASVRFLYAYYPLGNEADIRAVVREAWRCGKRVAFPKVFGDEMRYFEVSGFDQFSAGTFGVMEPWENRPVDWRSGMETLVLTPGVAFDFYGNRMGFGKGYYDRHFSAEHDCLMLGVAYGLQMAKRLPVGEFDVPLSLIVTEEQLTEV
ncbi:MAG: 5-formyltetrahydrofolate cyclo-ligase [Clostridiales bacterium]|nr:5-formyltetrahydrofolate cyclo-ligase [Clostridiales bacterium]